VSAPRPVALESVGCLLGCPRDDEVVLTGRDRLHGLPGEFQVLRCRSCGLLRTDPRPTPDSIDLYYPPEYGPYLGTRVVARRRSVWRRLRSTLGRVARRVADRNADHLPPMRPGRMLEVGCASGSFLRQMAELEWEVEGIEFSESAGREARELGYPVQIGALEKAIPPDQPYDLVVGWMVLEHLHDPVAGLKKLREWTKPGGWLVASVPNAACYELRLFGERWYALHLPNHLWHPTPDSLREVLARGGWRLDRIFYHRDLKNVIGSLGYWLADRRILPRLARWMSEYPDREGSSYLLLHPLSLLLGLLRQTGRITVWARRVD